MSPLSLSSRQKNHFQRNEREINYDDHDIHPIDMQDRRLRLLLPRLADEIAPQIAGMPLPTMITSLLSDEVFRFPL